MRAWTRPSRSPRGSACSSRTATSAPPLAGFDADYPDAWLQALHGDRPAADQPDATRRPQVTIAQRVALRRANHHQPPRTPDKEQRQVATTRRSRTAPSRGSAPARRESRVRGLHRRRSHAEAPTTAIRGRSAASCTAFQSHGPTGEPKAIRHCATHRHHQRLVKLWRARRESGPQVVHAAHRRAHPPATPPDGCSGRGGMRPSQAGQQQEGPAI
jgi:hypothetical protein